MTGSSAAPARRSDSSNSSNMCAGTTASGSVRVATLPSTGTGSICRRRDRGAGLVTGTGKEAGEIVMLRLCGLRVSFRIAALFAMLVFVPQMASAESPKCEADKLATKHPGLAGKTIKIGTDGETPPYAMRDPKDFNHLIGLDTELAEATFKCIGVPIE